jgi:hypothetical protein
MQPRVVGRDPLSAELVRLAADLGVPESTADTVARLEHDDLASCLGEPGRRDESRDTGSHDGHVDVDVVHPRRFLVTISHTEPILRAEAAMPSAARAAARPVRTAPSMYPATHWSEPHT